MFKNLKLSTKIGGGFALATLVLIITVSVTTTGMRRVNAVTDRTISLRVPTAQSSLMIINGINHSLAALRGWMILGKDKFKEERSFAWAEEIYKPLELIDEMSVNWTNPKNVERLRNIKALLIDFEKYQGEIEDIAQSIDNTPALRILFEDAAPQATILITNITAMIDIETTLPATPERKALLGMMADVRGSTGLALANIRAYLLSGDEKFREKFDAMWATNTRRFGDLSDNVGLLTAEQKTAFEAFSSARVLFDPLPPQMFEIRGGAEWNLANRWLGTKAAPTAAAILTDLNAMAANQKELMDTDVAQVKSLSASINTLAWIALAVGIVICALLGFFITRSIVGPINRVIAGMSEGSDQVSSASGQVSQSSQEMASGASEQAASLEEISASLEEMSSMTRQNADNAKQANSMATEAQGATEKSQGAMERMSEAIGKIKISSDETAKIIKTIDEIAFQTNLLALNAAVEAARAGDAGKGFAVVAEEVRNLARRSAEAAKNTSDLIADSQSNAESGVTASGEVASILKQIGGSIGKVTQLVTEVSAASNEQAQGIEQVNTAVAQLDKVTQSNAANAEESAAASEELTAQAVELSQMVGALTAIVGGSSGDGGAGVAVAKAPPARAKTPTVAPAERHHAAASATVAPQAEAKSPAAPQSVIPLTEDELEDF